MSFPIGRDSTAQVQQRVAETFRLAWQGQPAGAPGQAVVSLGTVGPLVDLRLFGRWERVEPLATQWLGLGWETSPVAGAPPWDVPRLQRWAEEVVRRVQYLPETLRLWEIDQPDGVAIVRSSEPARVDGQREYFELTCRASGGGLCRWQVGTDGTRALQPFPLVQATAFRALADLATALVSAAGAP